MTENEAEEKIKSLINYDFLLTLTEVAKLYGWSGDFCEISSFVEELHKFNGIEIENLEPYEIEEDDQ